MIQILQAQSKADYCSRVVECIVACTSKETRPHGHGDRRRDTLPYCLKLTEQNHTTPHLEADPFKRNLSANWSRRNYIISRLASDILEKYCLKITFMLT